MAIGQLGVGYGGDTLATVYFPSRRQFLFIDKFPE
jgi:hypothetical protein